jgi:hypothetical protein
MYDVLDYARQYISRDWSVVPVERGGLVAPDHAHHLALNADAVGRAQFLGWVVGAERFVNQPCRMRVLLGKVPPVGRISAKQRPIRHRGDMCPYLKTHVALPLIVRLLAG